MWHMPIIQQDRAICNKKCNWHLYWRSGKDTEEQKELDRNWVANTKQIETLAKKFMMHPELRLSEEERDAKYPPYRPYHPDKQAPKQEHALEHPSIDTKLTLASPHEVW